MSTPFYWKRTCHTCRQSRVRLQSESFDLDPIDILAQPPSVATLRTLIARYGARAMVRRNSDDYRRLGVGRLRLSDEELAELLHDHPDLSSRPIVLTPAGPFLAKDPAIADALARIPDALARNAAVSPGDPDRGAARSLPRSARSPAEADVDETSAESFPASDPPGWGGASIGRQQGWDGRLPALS